jgi:anti-sigma factor RsiW
MSQEPAKDDSQLREELVAYLDGELDAERSRRIEQQLADDPETRRAMQELDRTWHLLDELDAPAVDEDFTRTTLEMVAVAAVEDAENLEVEVPRRRRRRWVFVGGGLLAAALAGFLAVYLAAPDPNAQLLHDLPMLENFDQYRQVDNAEFLRTLDHEKLFTEDVDDAP